jgi:coenzyme F420-reducing hydrogenase alpha subunit
MRTLEEINAKLQDLLAYRADDHDGDCEVESQIEILRWVLGAGHKVTVDGLPVENSGRTS